MAGSVRQRGPEHGDCLALEAAGAPLAVIRGAAGALRAFANVCLHRGTLIYAESVNEKSRWFVPTILGATTSLARSRPFPDPGSGQIDRASHGLLRFRLEIWRGIVFIYLGAELDVLAERLAKFDELPRPLRFRAPRE